ncbi:MAG: hypothetical protein SGI92_26875 [Bryobacteraceae bacterium]|nr:hypothetical protein [Bryobacteraceae bacterium]
MADNNALELVVEVDVNKANASTRSINTGLSSMEQAAGRAARGASARPPVVRQLSSDPQARAESSTAD